MAEFDGARLTGDEAVGLVRELGAVRRLVDALAGKAAVRIDETVAYRRACDRSAADTLAKALGISAGEARRLKETAEKLPAHPCVDAEVRAGRLPARDAHLIVEALALAPEAEQRLLSAARRGVPARSGGRWADHEVVRRGSGEGVPGPSAR